MSHPNIVWYLYRLGEQTTFRRACVSAQSCQILHCLHTKSMELDKGVVQKVNPWSHSVAVYGRLKSVTALLQLSEGDANQRA